MLVLFAMLCISLWGSGHAQPTPPANMTTVCCFCEYTQNVTVKVNGTVPSGGNPNSECSSVCPKSTPGPPTGAKCMEQARSCLAQCADGSNPMGYCVYVPVGIIRICEPGSPPPMCQVTLYLTGSVGVNGLCVS